MHERFDPSYAATQNIESWDLVQDLASSPIESVAIRFPTSLDVFERRSRSAVWIHEEPFHDGRIRFFRHSAPNGPALPAIDISFQVPPTTNQKLLAQYALKFFGVLLVPLTSLAVLSSSSVKTPRARKLLLWIGGIVQLGILGSLLWWAVYTRSTLGLESIFDLVLVALGAAFTVVVALLKKPGDEQ